MKIKKIKTLSIILTSFMFLFIVSVTVFAAAPTPIDSGIDRMSDLVDLIRNIAGWFQAIVLIIAIIMIMYAGFLWMTAGGDDEKLGTARKTLIYGLVGIAVVVLAYTATAIVTNLMG
ncbi:hypothetical protein KKE74_00965 [Patescibacteria group bacterium]|nr:hypothetical protein [Patescibacteria group bacterium]MBU2472585.1 hypothetical protein [Patescibacteria group bacterium]